MLSHPDRWDRICEGHPSSLDLGTSLSSPHSEGLSNNSLTTRRVPESRSLPRTTFPTRICGPGLSSRDLSSPLPTDATCSCNTHLLCMLLPISPVSLPTSGKADYRWILFVLYLPVPQNVSSVLCKLQVFNNVF